MTTQKEPTLQELEELLELYNQGLFSDVIKKAEFLISRFPTCGTIWKILGITFEPLGLLDESLNANRNAIELLPNDAQAHLNVGIDLITKGLFNEAETILRKALLLESNYSEAYFNLGNALQKQNNLKEAANCYY
ncbi:MAG: hypothetical protein WBI40_05610 [Methylococcaceae bacterium]